MRRASLAPKPRGFRRLERWFVGVIMGVMAFVLEKVVLRSVRKAGRALPGNEPAPARVTSGGSAVDLDK
jgi:hypothetical protein